MYSRQQNAQKNGHFNSLVTDSPSTKNSENATVGSFELRMISREMIKNAKKKRRRRKQGRKYSEVSDRRAKNVYLH